MFIIHATGVSESSCLLCCLIFLTIPGLLDKMRHFDQLRRSGQNCINFNEGPRRAVGQNDSEFLANHLDGQKVEEDEERVQSFPG